MATSAIGLSLVSLHFRGQKRAIMGLVLIGMLCVTVEYFSFIYFLINDLVSLENPLYVFYLMASAMWFLAASEQDRLEPEAKAPAADAELEEHAKQWETLFPSFAVAGVFVLAFFFHNSFNEQTLPYLAAIAVVFVASLGARNWWGQRVETRLTAESKNSAALLLTANRMLREEVRTRTRAEEELRQSQKMEALGQLTGGVAHDFNNLLGVIQGNLELASLKAGNKEGRPTPSGRPDPISNAMDAVAQGASLTQYLLALSRKQALNPQPVDVVDLLLQTRNGLERTLGKAIKVRIKARNNPWTCLADRPQLESALLNLALNARDAMPEGGEVSFETINAILDEDYVASHPDVESGKYLMISVSDTGKGITKEHLKKVWDPFFTSKKKGEGTGLGLSTVYGFAKQSGGHVSIQSEVGVGTEVRLYLPKTDAPVRAAEAAAKGEAPLGNAETLLLVEDDDRLRGMLAQILEGLNYNVFTAASGSAALSILSENPATRLVLTDVMLVGGISGVDLEKEIRERELPVKVLLMSGYPAEELMKTGHHSQEVDLLPKPFTRLDVARKIRSVLEK
jgi:signal transduction histidine kinase